MIPRIRSKTFTLRPALAVWLLLLASCQNRPAQNSPSASSSPSNLSVAIQSPEAGEVHRLLVSPGATIENNAPLLEILVSQGGGAPPPPTPENRPPTANQSAGARLQSAENEAQAARAEAVRAESEVQRLTPLVAAGQASQGELDGARERYERAQQRLQRAQESAADDVIAERQ
jgi:pyruvate/2-oxoglutarate dehydrogenase complex dihydrolipoamide acyltransferase (E2) component